MAAAKPITVIGGGLAGLTLGIGLRQRGVPVTVAEAGHYPRHRVCGEFISGRGQETLQRLGLRELLERAGAVAAGTAAFFSTGRTTGPRPLPAPAICLSRFTLDALLAEQFRKLGGALQEGHRWPDEGIGEGAVRATGRQTRAGGNGARWFGLKAHARNVSLAAHLEMHFSPQGYVGLCRVNGNRVNVCGLFRPTGGDKARPQDRREWLRGPAGSLLRQRLATAEFDDDSFCAVAGISLQPQRAVARPDCCLGDAITMIPPVTGNGMSMAFESAAIAIAPLAAYSQGQMTWAEARRQIARRCDTTFARRLTWARWLQWLMISPALQGRVGGMLLRSEWLWRLMFTRTR